jgi:hypothetical protein
MYLGEVWRAENKSGSVRPVAKRRTVERRKTPRTELEPADRCLDDNLYGRIPSLLPVLLVVIPFLPSLSRSYSGLHQGASMYTQSEVSHVAGMAGDR